MNVSVRSRPRSGILFGAGAGLVAGIAMALVAMMATAAMGKGLFAPPAMIAGIILGPDAGMTQTAPVIMTGLVLHMVLSMMFGAVFAIVVPAIAGSYWLSGALYGLVLWVVNFYVLSFVSPGARAMAANEPLWLAAGSHLVFGIVLGALIARSTSHAGASGV